MNEHTIQTKRTIQYIKCLAKVRSILFSYGSPSELFRQRNEFKVTKNPQYKESFNAFQKYTYNNSIVIKYQNEFNISPVIIDIEEVAGAPQDIVEISDDNSCAPQDMVDVFDYHSGDAETLNNDDAGGENRGTVNAHSTLRNEIEGSDLDLEGSDLDLDQFPRNDEENGEEESEQESNGSDRLLDINDERFFIFGCANCHRRQSRFLIDEFEENSQYHIAFELHSTISVNSRRKFKHCASHRSEDRAVEIILCYECAHHLVSIDNTVIANQCQFTWPAFIWSLLKNADIHSKYGDNIWRFIPKEWRYWWLTSLTETHPNVFQAISIDIPSPIFVDRTMEIDEWSEDINSYELARLASTCNKHLMPKILCPWGCTEYNHRYVTYN